MVKEISAYAASDGKIFSSRLECLEHEAERELTKLDVFNTASAMAIVKNARAIGPILEAVAREQEAAETLNA